MMAAQFFPQLQTGGRMDRVVDAAVAGMEAAEQGAVRRVHDGVGPRAA
jgi:hypothetical protein